VKTTGKEEGGALYTRGAAIFLPEEFVRGLGSESRENVLIHELFHVLSRNAPDLQRRLYQIVGFQIGGDLDLPPALARRKITNPDAPRVNCYLPIEKEGRTLQLAPLLLAKSAEYDTARGGGVFAYLTLRLVEASPEGGPWICAPEGGEPRLHEIDSVPEYQEKIGRNTDYHHSPRGGPRGQLCPPRHGSRSAETSDAADPRGDAGRARASSLKTLVIGHKNPDTDSICSALAYAELLRAQGQLDVEAAACGEPKRAHDVCALARRPTSSSNRVRRAPHGRADLRARRRSGGGG
jgi:hypothetical protein